MSNKPTIVISESLQDKAMEYLADKANIIETDVENVVEVIGQADGLVVRTYTQVNTDLLEKAPKLKVVGRAGVALENIDVPACRARGVEVVHTPEANTLAVVDYTIRMMIEMNRKFWAMDGYVTPEEFHALRKNLFGHFMSDLTLGIIGVGRIGSRVGRIAKAMGMTVLCNDILPKEQLAVEYDPEFVEKDELFARSDIITIHVPATKQTQKFINNETISKMKDGVQFINAARGQCVDYPALGEALRTKKVGFAVIDCHDPEPMGEDYPLFGLENTILTPHAAACVPTAKANMSMVVTDVLAVCLGEKPKFPALPGSF